LTSINGGFGFTCGVEWLAREKIDVHGSSGLAWNSPENLIPELACLNRLLSEHPCFFDGARLTRVSKLDSPVYALLRVSEEGWDQVLVVVNTDTRPQNFTLDLHALSEVPHPNFPQRRKGRLDGEPLIEAIPNGVASPLSAWCDLLGQKPPQVQTRDGTAFVPLSAGGAYCLAPTSTPRGLHGDEYRRARARAAWGLTALCQLLPAERLGPIEWRQLAGEVDRSPFEFLAKISAAARDVNPTWPLSTTEAPHYPQVVLWKLLDRHRITLVPPNHWLLVQDESPFRASLRISQTDPSQAENVESIPAQGGHFAFFIPRETCADATLLLERYSEAERNIDASLRFISEPVQPVALARPHPTDRVLLTNGRGAMARLCVDLGRVLSKYDCVLGANLHPTLPVDRHILAKRIRVWVNADGFLSPLDYRCLAGFAAGPPAVWDFVANAGDGRTVEIQMTTEMLRDRNTTVFRFSRPTAALASGKQLPADADVILTIRLDIEDRNFHSETHHNSGAEDHFTTHTHKLPESHRMIPNIGFSFTPVPDRQLRVFVDVGLYHSQPEWSKNLPHPWEASRGQIPSGDAFSPGWFEIPMPKGKNATLVATAELADLERHELMVLGSSHEAPSVRPTSRGKSSGAADVAEPADLFAEQLVRAVQAFVVRRGQGKTVIAGYPWFLDWGRDTFICARGLLAAGMAQEVADILATFARFEKEGTLPNTLFGEDASNRDTSDAPLWFGLACEELAAQTGEEPRFTSVLESIARHYSQGTPNGIRMDPASGLVWSPSHFTWMDTNYPASTPREGYPVEIQALWIRLLLLVARAKDAREPERWSALAAQAAASFEQLFWQEAQGTYSDVLLAPAGSPARQAQADDALRSNSLLAVALGIVRGAHARRCVEVAQRYLLVPGAVRSLAPLPVKVPLPVYGPGGHLLNDPRAPYWGRYEGDEDTRRKPAYHNGTAWTWTFPIFCEALARAWDFQSEAVVAARACMGSVAELMSTSCLGQIPEVLDADAPHQPRGCDAQAWGATEALRVWRLLKPRH
jgi:predicted glycogen debranching enzyme